MAAIDKSDLIQSFVDTVLTPALARVEIELSQVIPIEPTIDAGFAELVNKTDMNNPPPEAGLGTAVTATTFTDLFIQYAQMLSSIRTATIRVTTNTAGVYVNNAGLANKVMSLNSTYRLSIANFTTRVEAGTNPLTPLVKGNPAKLAEVNTFIAKLNTVLANRAAEASFFIDTCHSSCHSSCHGSRGRR